jgi:hypothetical protein
MEKSIKELNQDKYIKNQKVSGFKRIGKQYNMNFGKQYNINFSTSRRGQGAMFGRRKWKKSKPEHFENKSARQRNKISISKNDVTHPGELEKIFAMKGCRESPDFTAKNKNKRFF